jgi:hypothetical protein
MWFPPYSLQDWNPTVGNWVVCGTRGFSIRVCTPTSVMYTGEVAGGTRTRMGMHVPTADVT